MTWINQLEDALQGQARLASRARIIGRGQNEDLIQVKETGVIYREQDCRCWTKTAAREDREIGRPSALSGGRPIVDPDSNR